MSKLTVTNIRLTKEELLEYRQMALAEGKSFSEYVREALGEKARGDMFGMKIGGNKKKQMDWEAAPIWNHWKYAKWSSGIKDGSKNHDKYIYGDPHGKKKHR